jgi:hypothetical protein
MERNIQSFSQCWLLEPSATAGNRSRWRITSVAASRRRQESTLPAEAVEAAEPPSGPTALPLWRWHAAPQLAPQQWLPAHPAASGKLCTLLRYASGGQTDFINMHTSRRPDASDTFWKCLHTCKCQVAAAARCTQPDMRT